MINDNACVSFISYMCANVYSCKSDDDMHIDNIFTGDHNRNIILLLQIFTIYIIILLLVKTT